MVITFIFHFLLAHLFSQSPFVEKFNIQYEIVQTEFHDTHQVIKIKLPAYLKTSEVMEQIRLAVAWPGEPLPDKVTRIYVFRDNEPPGSVSRTGAEYIPGKGFRWDLRYWNPDTSDIGQPGALEIAIYNTLLDSLLIDCSPIIQPEVLCKVARQFQVSPSKVDSIFWKVRRYIRLHGSTIYDSSLAKKSR